MKLHAILVATLVLAACSQPSDNAGAPPGAPAQAAPAGTAATLASASGTVEAVEAAAGKITISHGPVEALRWPAMTMRFDATPGQAASVRAGQKVRFQFRSHGTDGTITRIAPVE